MDEAWFNERWGVLTVQVRDDADDDRLHLTSSYTLRGPIRRALLSEVWLRAASLRAGRDPGAPGGRLAGCRRGDADRTGADDAVSSSPAPGTIASVSRSHMPETSAILWRLTDGIGETVRDVRRGIVGGELAGLTCARQLQARGRSCLVLEASDAVGGRVRTDRLDAFQLDRGFQVLLTAYPAVERWLDYDALSLRRFSAGARVWCDGALHVVSDPTREPGDLLATVRAPVGTLADLGLAGGGLLGRAVRCNCDRPALWAFLRVD